MRELRDAVGLRNLAGSVDAKGNGKQAQGAKAKAQFSFKQYREADGLHYFKLVDAGGRLLAQSAGFASPQEAGRAVAQLKKGGLAGLEALQPAQGVSPDQLAAAVAALSAS